MKKQITTLTTFCVIALNSFGQVTEGESKLRSQEVDTVNGWKKGGMVSVGLAQAAFSNSAGGGQNSINVNGMLNLYANLVKNKSRWDNMLSIGYGLQRLGDKGNFIKTDDKFELVSKYGLKASKNWYYAGLLSLRTQMTPGYNYPNDTVKISNFLAPGYVIGAIGMDYKPNDNFSAFIAPITSKNTIVNDQRLADAGAFGVQKAVTDASGKIITNGQKFRSEFGAYVRIMYKTTFFKDKSVSLLTKLDLFSNYFHNPQNIDVNWETIIGLKVNKYISATVGFTLVYDDDIKVAVDNSGRVGPRVQLKEILAVGLSYKF